MPAEARVGFNDAGFLRTLLVKQKDAALPPGNSPTPEWAANGTIHTVICIGSRFPLSRAQIMHLSNESLLVIIIVGIVAGWLAGRVMEGGGFGLIGDLLVLLHHKV
jgi:hypothetical protein